MSQGVKSRAVPRWAWIVAAVFMVGLIGTVVSGEDETDGSAELACSHFRNVSAEADLLTDEEIRDKMREVYDDARYSEDPEIAEASRDMLAAATAGDVASFGEAVERMEAACSDVGL